MPKLPNPEPNSAAERHVLDLDAVEQSSEPNLTLQIAKDAAKTAEASMARQKIIVGAAFQGFQAQLQAHNGLFAEIARMQEQIAKTVVPTLQMMDALRPTLMAVGEMARTLVSNSFVEMLKSALETIKSWQSAFAKSLSTMTTGWLANLTSSIKRLIPNNFLSGILPRIGAVFDIIPRIPNYIAEAFKAAFDFSRLIAKSNVVLIVRAAEGHRPSIILLGKIWFSVMLIYFELSRMEGRPPTKEEFYGMLQEACNKFINEEDKHGLPFYRLARGVFYYLVGLIAPQYVQLKTKQNMTVAYEDGIEFTSGNGDYLHVWVDSLDNQEKLFTKDAALLAGVTPQTIRDWIGAGELEAVSAPYYSRLRRATTQALLLPYTNMTASQLAEIQTRRAKNQRHQIDGYYTIQQVREHYGNAISRKTLERWDSQGDLSPMRINGKRYYSEEQVNEVGKILLRKNSPKIRALLKANPAY